MLSAPRQSQALATWSWDESKNLPSLHSFVWPSVDGILRSSVMLCLRQHLRCKYAMIGDPEACDLDTVVIECEVF